MILIIIYIIIYCNTKLFYFKNYEKIIEIIMLKRQIYPN